ncbi:dethiobiotin synthase [Pendulispora albinea]|uniref:ATP-dependent dethiobiotin synthetase BioD n=1 Tax=Pendulispora albinea TaxID=2741071 RepID=A0ABZ2LWY8_9BACT
MKRIFITGIGTGVGKTLAAACVTEALKAHYWKPVQAGLDEGTDTETVKSLVSNAFSVCHPEAYRLREPASPHLAARMEGITIDPAEIVLQADAIQPPEEDYLVIEGAGGLLVPLNEDVFTIDLIRALRAQVIIVAQNYLGSINHSLLTARVLQHSHIPVLGWIFSGAEHTNEADIVRWSELPLLGHIPTASKIDAAFVRHQALRLVGSLGEALDQNMSRYSNPPLSRQLP